MNDTPFIKKGRFTSLSVVLMFLLPVVTALICLCVGRMSVPLGDVLHALQSLFTGETAGVQNYSIIVNLRLPRILMAMVVGAGLTCAGNTYQALFSNPLATPDILGVTSGTCVGAILAIILSCSIFETQLIALVFGLLSVWFTLKIAGKNSNRSMVYLVLAGVIASSLFNAVGSLLKYTADPQDKLPEITYWLKRLGVTDVVAEEASGFAQVNMEQVYTWDPDILFLDGPGLLNLKTADVLNNNVEGADFSTLSAVRNGRVYNTTLGMWNWFTPNPDAPLVLAWLASRAYPDAFADYPLEDTIREYYKTWYGYDMTDDELAQMLVY